MIGDLSFVKELMLCCVVKCVVLVFFDVEDCRFVWIFVMGLKCKVGEFVSGWVLYKCGGDSGDMERFMVVLKILVRYCKKFVKLLCRFVTIVW